MNAPFDDGVYGWIAEYVNYFAPDLKEKGRGMIVVRVDTSHCQPTFASLVSCSDENLSMLGANHAESEVIREVIRAYDEESEIPILIKNENHSGFRLVLEQFQFSVP